MDANLVGAYLVDLARARNVPSISNAQKEPAGPREPWRRRTPEEIRDSYRRHHPDVPVVERLDTLILDAVTKGGGKLEMGSWHTCETTHCRAGWAIHLAGKPGYDLESKHGSRIAGAMIYRASTGRAPHFFASNVDAMADIERCAAAEKVKT